MLHESLLIQLTSSSSLMSELVEMTAKSGQLKMFVELRVFLVYRREIFRHYPIAAREIFGPHSRLSIYEVQVEAFWRSERAGSAVFERCESPWRSK